MIEALCESWIGRAVLARSSESGVWVGELVACAGDSVSLSEARRIWSWSGAGSCSGLAAHGPREGRIAPPVDALVSDVCELLIVSDEALERIAAVPEWRP